MKKFEDLKVLIDFAEKDVLAFYEKNNKTEVRSTGYP